MPRRSRRGPIFEVDLEDETAGVETGAGVVIVGKEELMLDVIEKYVEQIPRFAQYVFRRLKYERKIQVDYEIKLVHDERGLPQVEIKIKDYRDVQPIVKGVITGVKTPKREEEKSGKGERSSDHSAGSNG